MGFDSYLCIGIDAIITGKRIEKLRIQGGYTVEQFAEMLGVSPNAYYKWVRGENLPALDTLVVIKRCCGIPLDDIVATLENEEKDF